MLLLLQYVRIQLVRARVLRRIVASNTAGMLPHVRQLQDALPLVVSVLGVGLEVRLAEESRR